MFCIALHEGEKFSRLSWWGLGLALLGVLYLVLPGVSAPDPLGAVLMAISGAAWGFFSLLARGVDHPVEANADNLLWCLLPAALVNLYCLGDFNGTPTGFGLAIASGAVATGSATSSGILPCAICRRRTRPPFSFRCLPLRPWVGSRFWPSRCRCGC
jgi:drug/metabolite transporter (DMT)-like permease